MLQKNQKNYILFFSFFIILFIFLSIIIISNAESQNNSVKNKEKMNYELQYISKELIDISHIINQFTTINWYEAKNKLQNLYTFWNSAILDFSQLEMDKTVLTEFGKNMDYVSISIKNQNLQECNQYIVSLYNTLMVLSENININNTNLMKANYNLMNAYIASKSGNWTLIQDYVSKSDTYISEMMTNIEDTDSKQYNLNQAYIAIKELENSIVIKDLELFYWKYTIVMEKLNNL